MSEEMKNEKVQETMEDFAAELEASYKEYDEKRSQAYVADETPDAEKWQEVKQLQADHAVVNVKIKEIVKGGAVAYLDELRAFIPASQLSLEYVEKLEDWVGRHIEAYIITADPENKKLVLSAKELLKERRDAEVKDGVTGLLHISQISNQRIKHPGVVLKEGQKVKVKILSVADGKISLSMKALEADEQEEPVDFHYESTGEAATGLGDLLKNLKF